ncbi:hypothetical protein Hanom_Chr06g00537821 [Helianthus anomalus]
MEIQQVNLSAHVNQTPSIQTPPDNITFMAQVLSAPVHGLTAKEVNSYLCTPECRGRVAAYLLHNSELISDLQDIKGITLI